MSDIIDELKILNPDDLHPHTNDFGIGGESECYVLLMDEPNELCVVLNRHYKAIGKLTLENANCLLEKEVFKNACVQEWKGYEWAGHKWDDAQWFDAD